MYDLKCRVYLSGFIFQYAFDQKLPIIPRKGEILIINTYPARLRVTDVLYEVHEDGGYGITLHLDEI